MGHLNAKKQTSSMEVPLCNSSQHNALNAYFHILGQISMPKSPDILVTFVMLYQFNTKRCPVLPLQISSLEQQKKLPPGLTRKSPLHQLAPVIIRWVRPSPWSSLITKIFFTIRYQREFIVPLAPTPSQMEEHWTSSRGAIWLKFYENQELCCN